MVGEKETLCMMALTRVPRLNVLNQKLVLEAFGRAEAVYENRKEAQSVIPDASPLIWQNLLQMEAILPRVRQEYEWAKSKQIECLCITDDAYPSRLRECSDAPLVLYYRGNANLNCQYIISMVGMRQCSEYGKDLCRNFMAELKDLCPDCLIVSGLAYGIDINAHRNALQNGFKTVGVLAHGMDQIYPRLHQNTAIEMLGQGGLLTEYMSGTSADKMNFVARNRIVAGLADATIVVESAAKGGSLITAGLACDYNRDLFAFPGRVKDVNSAGCNALIKDDKAHLITSAQDVVEMLGWQTEEQTSSLRKKPVQRELFVELTEEEKRVVEALQGVDNKSVNQISIDAQIGIGKLSALLLGLEMKGVVKMLNGGLYRLL